MKFNLTPCVEIEPKITLNEALKEQKKLAKKLWKMEQEAKRIQARQESLQYVVKFLEKKQEQGAA
jgi:hypothetical protein